MHPMNVPAKLELHSFTCSWVNSGYPKIGAVPGYAHTKGGHRVSGMVLFERALVSSYRPSTVTFLINVNDFRVTLLQYHTR